MLPYIRHSGYNRRQLKRLLHALYPGGIEVEQGGIEPSARDTKEKLARPHAVLFDACFLCEGLFARVPLLEKDGEKVTVLQVQTRAFDPEHNSLDDGNGSIRSGWKDYLSDFAYRLYVISRSHPEWKLEPYLVLPDKSAEARIDRIDRLVARGEPVDSEDISNLIALVPVSNQIKRIWDGTEPVIKDESHSLYGKPFEECLELMTGWHANGERVFTGVGKKCAGCEFRVKERDLDRGEKSGFKECWESVLPDGTDKEHVFDLIGAGNRQLIEKEIYLQENASLAGDLTPERIEQTEGKLNDRQRRMLQIAKAKGMEVPGELVKPRLLEEIGCWEYPLHFLDFEAGSYAVPSRAGHRPYQLLVFQYSCHTLHHDGTLNHFEWLHPADDTHPNFQFAEALKQVPALLEGTVVQYSGFERSALKKIYRELKRQEDAVGNSEELREWIEQIIGRDDSNGAKAPYLADMGRLVKNYYYNIRMDGSLSIKEVLRSVMEVSPILKKRFSRPYAGSNYDNIIWWQRRNGGVRNPYELLRERRLEPVGRGTEAMVAYARLRSAADNNEDEREKLRLGLRSYCELDTLAMVMIYLHWKELLNGM